MFTLLKYRSSFVYKIRFKQRLLLFTSIFLKIFYLSLLKYAALLFPVAVGKSISKYR